MNKKIIVSILYVLLIATCFGCAHLENNTHSQDDIDDIQRQISSEVPIPSTTPAPKSENDGAHNVSNVAAQKKKKNISSGKLVRVRKYIPSIRVDLRYASGNNFTDQKIYDFEDAYLRYGTVKKLKKVQKKLRKEKLSLLIWDAYRPVNAQYKLWDVCPNPKYVANPNNGFSSHSRGNAVDITIYSLEKNKLLDMPTDFDDFSAKADRDYNDCSSEERNNAEKLEEMMIEAGFLPYSGEWWHFSDRDNYSVKKEVKNLH